MRSARIAKDLPAQVDRHRLVWLLQFAQADLSRWKPGDWLNGLEALGDLAYSASAGPTVRPPLQATAEEARARVQPIQREVRRVIDKLAPSGANTARRDLASTVATVPFSGDVRLIGAASHNFRIVYVPKGPASAEGLSSGVLLRLVDLLGRVRPLTLKRCPEADCQRLFLANRKQKFDTGECSARDRARRLKNLRPSQRGRRGTTS